MRLVLDTNILIAALIKDSLTREIFFAPGFEFLLPGVSGEGQVLRCNSPLWPAIPLFLGYAELHY
jgi:hypothetical protein